MTPQPCVSQCRSSFSCDRIPDQITVDRKNTTWLADALLRAMIVNGSLESNSKWRASVASGLISSARPRQGSSNPLECGHLSSLFTCVQFLLPTSKEAGLVLHRLKEPCSNMATTYRPPHFRSLQRPRPGEVLRDQNWATLADRLFHFVPVVANKSSCL